MKKFSETNLYKIRFIVLFLIFVFFTSVISSYINYKVIDNILSKNINYRLKNAAMYANLLLGEDFHDIATSKSSITRDHDYRNAIKLSEFANNDDIEYIYTIIIVDSKAYFTSSSATHEEIALNDVYDYFTHYEEATPKLLNIFKENKIVYEITKDKWGTFKSILIPMKTKNGVDYIVGADIKIDFVKYEIYKSIIVQSILILILLLGGLFFFFKSKKDIRIINKLNKDILNMSKIDNLTNLFNKKYFYEIANSVIFSLSDKDNKDLSLLIIDIDHFKKINDKYGHIQGDVVIKMISEVMLKRVRKIDTVSRFGGEEFLILLPDTEIASAYIVAEKIRKIVERLEIKDKEELIKVTISIGVCQYKDHYDIDTFINKADIALYEAKNNGRNCVRVNKN